MVGSRYLGLALGILSFSGGALAQSAPNPLHLVSVTGTGEATAKPDRARLSLSVELLNPDLKKAQDDADRVVRAYLRDAKALGAKDEDITTTAASINPEYVWPEPGRERRFSGYRVVRQVEVRIANLDKLGDFLLKAAADGVTQVNPPLLESSKTDELTRQALARAADNARAKAKVLAEQLGAKLGSVQRISESGANAVAVPMVYTARVRAAPDDSGNGQMGISLGEIRVEASISADFDLLPP